MLNVVVHGMTSIVTFKNLLQNFSVDFVWAQQNCDVFADADTVYNTVTKCDTVRVKSLCFPLECNLINNCCACNTFLNTNKCEAIFLFLV